MEALEEGQEYMWGRQEAFFSNHRSKEKAVESDSTKSAWGMDRNQSLPGVRLSAQVNSKNSFRLDT